jgi:hypothetical protein
VDGHAPRVIGTAKWASEHSYTTEGLIDVLLVIAIVMVLVNFMQGRRVS